MPRKKLLGRDPLEVAPLRAYRGFAALWAGAVLGGSLVAAPAKFQVASLAREVALQVGRAQFYWLGVAEIVLCTALLLATILSARARWRWVLVALFSFCVQRLGIMPLLDERTLQIVAGIALPPSNLHLTYVVLEICKVAALTRVVFASFTPKKTE